MDHPFFIPSMPVCCSTAIDFGKCFWLSLGEINLPPCRSSSPWPTLPFASWRKTDSPTKSRSSTNTRQKSLWGQVSDAYIRTCTHVSTDKNECRRACFLFFGLTVILHYFDAPLGQMETCRLGPTSWSQNCLTPSSSEREPCPAMNMLMRTLYRYRLTKPTLT